MRVYADHDVSVGMLKGKSFVHGMYSQWDDTAGDFDQSFLVHQIGLLNHHKPPCGIVYGTGHIQIPHRVGNLCLTRSISGMNQIRGTGRQEYRRPDILLYEMVVSKFLNPWILRKMSGSGHGNYERYGISQSKGNGFLDCYNYRNFFLVFIALIQQTA